MPDGFMPEELTLRERTYRIAHRLQMLEQVFDWMGDDEEIPAPPRAGFWTGLSEILSDVRRDVWKLQRVPFPLTEWAGETWEEFRAAHHKPTRK